MRFKIKTAWIMCLWAMLIGAMIEPNDSAVKAAASGLTMLGADVSTLQQAEDLGAKFFDAKGKPGEALPILRDNGVNYIRLRVWVNPQNGYNNSEKVLIFAKKVKALGLKLMIDFHYSDTWADPGKQFKPTAWIGHDLQQLQRDVYEHTFVVCSALKAQDTTPDSVQIGNEINPGLLWPEGRIDNNNFSGVSLLLKAGYRAVKMCNGATQVIIHIANAGDEAGARWFFDGVKAQGVDWDMTALSYYSIWHGTPDAMKATVADMIARYGRPVIIAETAYPYTLENVDRQANVVASTAQLMAGYPATQDGQYENLRDVFNAAESGGAVGVFYWEPTWIQVDGLGWDPADPTSGNVWDNMALFDAKGIPTKALRLFNR